MFDLYLTMMVLRGYLRGHTKSLTCFVSKLLNIHDGLPPLGFSPAPVPGVRSLDA
jgi:hypothetical protein